MDENIAEEIAFSEDDVRKKLNRYFNGENE